MKIDDTVEMSPKGRERYGNDPCNPYSLKGKIIDISVRPCTHPIQVQWPKNKINSYTLEDLIVVNEHSVINNNYEIY